MRRDHALSRSEEKFMDEGRSASGSRNAYDFIIVGAGIFGTSTAYHLAQTYPDPSRILVIDRAPCPSPQAASSDINKIVRADYSKSFYMDLAYEALDSWMHDPILSKYYHNTGWIMLDEKDSDVAERIRKNFQESGRPDPSSGRSLDEVKSSWGGVLSDIDTTNFTKAYFNSSAGWADASLAVDAWMQIVISKGIRYVTGEAKLVTDSAGLVQITANDTTYTSSKILMATGAWTSYLMTPLEDRLNIDPALSIHRQIQAAGVCVAAFKLDESDSEQYGQMPVLVYGSKGEVMPPNRDGMFKFTNANTFLNTVSVSGKSVSVPRSDQKTIPPSLKQQSIDLISQRVPQVLHTREPDDWRLCWDAVSPDQNQLICQHPLVSNLYFATAGSFHSWKFLPNIGKYVISVLNGLSNGKEKDAAWCWKTQWSSRGAHEKVAPKGELRDYETHSGG